MDPSTYTTKGYLLQGSIRADGDFVHLLAFKLKELQCVRFKRLPEDRLPDRITSTIGGVDHYLREIHNVATTKEDVMKYWQRCPPDQIKIVYLDLGQAFVAGVSVLLPKSFNSTIMITASSSSTLLTTSASPSSLAAVTSTDKPQPDVFFNLAVNQKAVRQPTFRHRKWLEEQKSMIPAGSSDSISDIESNMPPLRGKDANISKYLAEVERV